MLCRPMTSKQKPSNLCVFIQTIMSLLCGRGAITCYGTRKAAAFVSTSAHLGTRPFQKYVPDARSQVPFIKQQSLLYSSTASNSASKHSDEGAFDRILPFEEHSHNSIKITVPQNDLRDTDDQFDIETFYSKLKATVVTAKQLHKTAIWITIPITKARLMEHSHKCGFEFHHAEKNVATLSKWLLDGEESRIPTFATHQVGVGAVAINRETNEILCVREKRNNYRPWKMPGGLAELGEDLDEAVVREVYEETGIKCRFLSILGVRHTHGLQFGRSDLYFLCRLEPVPDSNGKVAQPIPQEGEIEAAAWVPLDEYRAMVNNPDSKIGHPMMKQIMKLADQGEWNEYDIQKTIVSSVVPGRMGSPVYHAAVRSDSRGEIPE